MKKERGFTLIELMVVVAILGVLGATAMPLYNTWQQRAYGSEAVVMMKQLTEGQILYFLENDHFFPPIGPDNPIFVNDDYKGTPIPADATDQIFKALNLSIKSSGQLRYQITNQGDGCLIQIEASFPLFKNGQTYIWGQLDSKGNVVGVVVSGAQPFPVFQKAIEEQLT